MRADDAAGGPGLRAAAVHGDGAHELLGADARRLRRGHAGVHAAGLRAPAPCARLCAAARGGRRARHALRRPLVLHRQRAHPVSGRAAAGAGRVFPLRDRAAVPAADRHGGLAGPQRARLLPAGVPADRAAVYRFLPRRGRAPGGTPAAAARAPALQPGAGRAAFADSAVRGRRAGCHAGLLAAVRAAERRALRLCPAPPARHRGLSVLHRRAHHVLPEHSGLAAARRGAARRPRLPDGRAGHAGLRHRAHAAARHGQEHLHRQRLDGHDRSAPLPVHQPALRLAAAQPVRSRAPRQRPARQSAPAGADDRLHAPGCSQHALPHPALHVARRRGRRRVFLPLHRGLRHAQSRRRHALHVHRQPPHGRERGRARRRALLRGRERPVPDAGTGEIPRPAGEHRRFRVLPRPADHRAGDERFRPCGRAVPVPTAPFSLHAQSGRPARGRRLRHLVPLRGAAGLLHVLRQRNGRAGPRDRPAHALCGGLRRPARRRQHCPCDAAERARLGGGLLQRLRLAGVRSHAGHGLRSGRQRR